MVLAELPGGVTEIVEELGDHRGAGPQIARAPGELRRDHAGAQRVHAGEERVAPGGAALHRVIVGEDRTLLPNTVDVGRFAERQPAVVDADLHPADVVAHDEKDVGLRRRRLGERRTQKRGRGQQEPSGRCTEPHPSEISSLHLCHLSVNERDERSPDVPEAE